MLKRRLKTPPKDYISNQAHCATSDTTSPKTLSHPGFASSRYTCLGPQLTLPLDSYSPSQADVATYKGVNDSPNAAKYPHVYRWYKHITSYQADFSSLPGDPSKAYTTYGPEETAAPTPAASVTKAPDAAEEDEDDDLFGSESEEEDPEAVKRREENLAAYRKKKEGKVKPAAKSIVTLDVKPWGKIQCSYSLEDFQGGEIALI